MLNPDYQLIRKNRFSKTYEFPVCYVRGGTSTGVIIWEKSLPRDQALKEELLKIIMGVPIEGKNFKNNQLTGLGRILPTTNKAFLIEAIVEGNDLLRFNSTLAQMSSEHSEVDWSVNCGNISSAIPLWALTQGFLTTEDYPELEIFNTNTGVTTLSRLHFSTSSGFKTLSIPGIEGAYPGVDLYMLQPSGSKTGATFPTGNVIDIIDGIEVSCVDVAVPMVIVNASALGKTGKEPVTALMEDAMFLSKLKKLWIAAGIKMGLKNKSGSPMTHEELESTETVPKICIVATPDNDNANISVRYFTPQKAHSSLAVSGGCCLASACLFEGTVANKVVKNLEINNQNNEFITEIKIENPAGILGTSIVYRLVKHQKIITKASCSRNAQILMSGWVPIINPSRGLLTFFETVLSNIDK